MKVYALLNWHDEQPEHLRRCVRSLKGFADVIVAVDGPYEGFPYRSPESPSVQHWALGEAARTTGLQYFLVGGGVWASEVEKRAAMFEYGRQAGATSEDWILIIDADMSLAEFTSAARMMLEVTEADVAEVRWHDVMVNGMPSSTHTFRSMFRALPGLTVERTHYLYTVPCGPEEGWPDIGRRFLWHVPTGQISPEPALDLTAAVTLHHHNSSRDPERKLRALKYYGVRDAAHLESAGDWR